MLYKFKDTIVVSEGITLPSEAMQINGEYIENVIVGYRTLQVSGREALAPELDLLETAQDGARLKNKRYPARTITVKYQLCTESPEAFRQAYNDLGRILNCTDAELIFNDEQDKYFIGTPYRLGEVPPGKNNVVSTFEILCIDPFKYSCIEYEATPSPKESSILIDYQGTHRAFPILEADMYNESETSEDGETVQTLTGAGDCGFVAFFNENEKIIQLGDPEELDGEEAYEKSQTLINNTYTTANAWGSAAQEQWTKTGGALGMGVASYEKVATPSRNGATLFHGNADFDNPLFNYKVVAKTSKRTASSVRIDVTITAALTRSTSYFGRGYGLEASIFIANEWHTVLLKNTSAYWSGKTGHSVNKTITVSGLNSSTSVLTGIKFKVERTDRYNEDEDRSGELEERNCNALALDPHITETPSKYFLKATDYGSGTGAHGATMRRAIPKDKAGTTGAQNFTFSFAQKFSVGSGSAATSQHGRFSVQITDANNYVIAGINLNKSAAGKTAKLEFVANNKITFAADVDIAYGNALFTESKQQYIRKQGNLITFNCGGHNKSFRILEETPAIATHLSCSFMKYGEKTALDYNGLFWVKFIKDNCDVWRNIPNKFSAGDVVEAHCRDCKIYLNGVAAPELGAIGNNWEDFYLSPGLNQIGFACSEWLTGDYIPAVKVRYREVFL